MSMLFKPPRRVCAIPLSHTHASGASARARAWSTTSNWSMPLSGDLTAAPPRSSTSRSPRCGSATMGRRSDSCTFLPHVPTSPRPLKASAERNDAPAAPAHATVPKTVAAPGGLSPAGSVCSRADATDANLCSVAELPETTTRSLIVGSCGRHLLLLVPSRPLGPSFLWTDDLATRSLSGGLRNVARSSGRHEGRTGRDWRDMTEGRTDGRRGREEPRKGKEHTTSANGAAPEGF